jgi:hypothetical protein
MITNRKPGLGCLSAQWESAHLMCEKPCVTSPAPQKNKKKRKKMEGERKI